MNRQGLCFGYMGNLSAQGSHDVKSSKNEAEVNLDKFRGGEIALLSGGKRQND